MAKLGTEDKRLFIIASGDPARSSHFSELVRQHINNSMIYTAEDGLSALFKMENVPPHVLIADWDLPKMDGLELTSKVLSHPKLSESSVIIASPIPDREHFVDQVVTGQVQFLNDIQDKVLVASYLSRALNRLADSKDFAYRLKFLAPHEILFEEGATANSVFIVKRGELMAFKGQGADTKVLGSIHMGEFVGEMAHINQEPRSATVKALTDCELIEIPTGTLDMVLFSKPAWSKALVATLSKRLKRSNEIR